MLKGNTKKILIIVFAIGVISSYLVISQGFLEEEEEPEPGDEFGNTITKIVFVDSTLETQSDFGSDRDSDSIIVPEGALLKKLKIDATLSGVVCDDSIGHAMTMVLYSKEYKKKIESGIQDYTKTIQIGKELKNPETITVSSSVGLTNNGCSEGINEYLFANNMVEVYYKPKLTHR